MPREFRPGQPKIDVFEVTETTRSSPNDEKSSALVPSGPPPPPTPAPEMAEAMYNFQKTSPSDLALYPGQQIQIIEKLNSDWWRGKDVQSGIEGIFPSNYVRITQGPPPIQEKAPVPYGGAAAPPSYGASSYQYAPPPQQQPFPPPSTNYYPPPAAGPVQPQQQQVVQQEQQPHQHSAVAEGAKKFGGKLGNAAIFGAGATIGSNIVNSIF